MSATLSSLGELAAIKLISRGAVCPRRVVKGIGDDTAVLRYSGRQDLLLTTDMLVEKVHFTRRMPAGGVGHKALACSISDIAAMGGTPTDAVVSLGAPPRTDAKYLKELSAGLKRTARRFGVAIVGGDTVRAGQLMINVALLGLVKRGGAVYRNGAKAKDKIFVTGPLGRSLLSGRHLSFVPRCKEAQYLCRYCRPNAMLDISDGLVTDLGRICRQSGVGAKLYEEDIPCHPQASVRQALYDGEDFELLFTVPPGQARTLLTGRGRGRFFCVGEICRGDPKLLLMNRKGQTRALTEKGFRHF